MTALRGKLTGILPRCSRSGYWTHAVISHVFWCRKGVVPVKDGCICISDLIALKVRRTKPHFSVSSNVLAENGLIFTFFLLSSVLVNFVMSKPKNMMRV